LWDLAAFGGELVAGGFAEGAAVVVASHERAGFRIYGDEFGVAPGPWAVLVLGAGDADGIAVSLHGVDDALGESFFKFEDVGEVLVVEAWGVCGGLDVEAIVDDGDEVVGDGGDDRRPAG
jgi:hypothetical protein